MRCNRNSSPSSQSSCITLYSACQDMSQSSWFILYNNSSRWLFKVKSLEVLASEHSHIGGKSPYKPDLLFIRSSLCRSPLWQTFFLSSLLFVRTSFCQFLRHRQGTIKVSFFPSFYITRSYSGSRFIGLKH